MTKAELIEENERLEARVLELEHQQASGQPIITSEMERAVLRGNRGAFRRAVGAA